jgi:hypothetical protein
MVTMREAIEMCLEELEEEGSSAALSQLQIRVAAFEKACQMSILEIDNPNS